MSPDIVIRPERPDQADVAALLDALDLYLAGLYAPEHNHILDVQALLAADVRFLVARCDGRAVGCGAVRLMPAGADSAGQAYGEIKRMYVAPNQRGQGLAERVLRRLERQLCAENVRLAMLETGRDQLEAVRLYERCGYVRRGAFGGYPDNGLSLFYEKRLRP